MVRHRGGAAARQRTGEIARDLAICQKTSFVIAFVELPLPLPRTPAALATRVAEMSINFLDFCACSAPQALSETRQPAHMRAVKSNAARAVRRSCDFDLLNLIGADLFLCYAHRGASPLTPAYSMAAIRAVRALSTSAAARELVKASQQHQFDSMRSDMFSRAHSCSAWRAATRMRCTRLPPRRRCWIP